MKPARGRPRNEDSRLRVLEAARALMGEGGLGAVTIEELALRAGVTRPTIYRSWPNARAVAMAALIATPQTAPASQPGQSIATDLKQALDEVVAAFLTPVGRSAASLIAASDPSTELSRAFRNHLLLETRERVVALLAGAVGRGELRAGIDIEVAADLLMAPVFFRLLVGHQPISQELAGLIVDQALKGLAA